MGKIGYQTHQDEFELYLSDLTDNAQKEVLEFLWVSVGTEGNYDVVPLTILQKPEK